MQPGNIAIGGERRRPPSPRTPIAAANAGDGGAGLHDTSPPPPMGSGIADPGERRRGYFGAKSGAGVWQRIINQIPPCNLFIEAFAGSATITRRLRPAAARIVIDNDPAACEALTTIFSGEGLAGNGDKRSEIVGNGDTAGVTVICADAVSWMEEHRGEFNSRTVVYCDPPYLFEVRSGGRRQRYRRELGETWSHTPLLAVCSRMTTQGVNILISGYRSALYDQMLGAWRRIDYRCMTRGGPRTECLWCNFPEPTELHDYRFLGNNFREREYLKRKKARWTAKLDGMAPRERAALLAAIDEWRCRRSAEPAMSVALAIPSVAA